MRLGVVTARGGSKRIPRKNVREFCGRPIIAYSISAALEAGCFDEVMVSTDDRGIAEVGRSCGAVVPFMRSAETATDQATTAEVLLEVLRAYEQLGRKVDVACVMYPTAPFLTAASLVQSLEILEQDAELESVIPITPFTFPIQRALRLTNGLVSMCQPEHALTRSQDLEPTFHDAGQFYWVRVPAFLAAPRLVGVRTAGVVLPPWQVQDIDNEEDWVMAELKFRALQAGMPGAGRGT